MERRREMKTWLLVRLYESSASEFIYKLQIVYSDVCRIFSKFPVSNHGKGGSTRCLNYRNLVQTCRNSLTAKVGVARKPVLPFRLLLGITCLPDGYKVKCAYADQLENCKPDQSYKEDLFITLALCCGENEY